MQLFSVEKNYFTFEETKMAYYRRPGSYPLVLIHGFTASSEIWDPLVEQLDKKFDLILVDLFGHGNSETPAFSDVVTNVETVLSFQASAIAELIHNLGLKNFGIIGSSLGGWVSMELAVRYSKPQRVVLIDTAGVVPLSDLDFKNGLSLLVQLYNSQENKLTPVLNKLLNCEDVNATLMDKYLLKNADFRISVLWGTDDPVFKMEYGRKFSSMLSDSSFTPIENAGHTPFTTNPEEVASIVNDFFKN